MVATVESCFVWLNLNLGYRIEQNFQQRLFIHVSVTTYVGDRLDHNTVKLKGATRSQTGVRRGWANMQSDWQEIYQGED